MSKIKSLTKIIIAGCLIISASQAFAYEVKSRKVSYLRTYDTYAVVSLNTAGPNNDNCSRSNAGKYARIDLSSGKNKAIYATILTAHVTGRRITVGLSGCKAWGSTTIPKAFRVDMYAN